MYLFFDTETNGLPKNWKAGVSNLSNWPRLVQIAWILYDNEGHILDKNDHIIKPVGFSIPRSASKIHGITTPIATAKGEDLKKVLDEYNSQITKSHSIVAHNINFDEKIVGAEFLKAGLSHTMTNTNFTLK